MNPEVEAMVEEKSNKSLNATPRLWLDRRALGASTWGLRRALGAR
jgi:hypothetical protein